MPTNSNPSSGKGLEITYAATADRARILPYDRDTSTFKDLEIGNVNQLYLKADGNVSIGTSSTYEKLYVAGNIKASGNIETDGRFLFKGSVPGSAIGASGDVAGMIACNATYLFICTGSYDGTTHIWTRTALTAW